MSLKPRGRGWRLCATDPQRIGTGLVAAGGCTDPAAMGLGDFTAGSLMLVVGPIAIDLVEREVTRTGRVVRLRHREYALLLAFARHPGKILGEMWLLEAVWGLRFHPGTNRVAVHISRLRAAIDAGTERPLLKTVRGCGYTLDVGRTGA